ncbi:MAG: DNA adenine methylase, partial [Hymenobacteraceae bacterium]|nr:DNA adenine methylase [Hymenobacteraceae bacterium]MDX5514008.1 DNA adenine methylase [Hymenobacteraceae bacterium]
MSKAFLRWAGSKKKILPILSKYYSSDFNKYIEPFVGSAQLFFNLPVKRAVLSDLNPELVNTYNAIKKNPVEL